MSQNDVIILDTKTFKVTHTDIESGGSYIGFHEFKSLRAAIKYAKKLQDEVEPEYGIHIV
jgi:hypothetical protein